MRKPGVVPDQRTCPSLSARDVSFEHHRVEPFGRRVHGCSQAGRPGADDCDVAGIEVVCDLDADGTGKIGQARVNADPAVVADHGREPRRVESCLAKEAAADLAFRPVDAERQTETGHHVTESEDPAVAFRCHDPKLLEARLVLPRPGREILGHDAVHAFLVRPWSDQVIVSASKRDRLNRRTRGRVVPIDEQHPLGGRMQFLGIRKRSHRGIVHEQQGNRGPRGREFLQGHDRDLLGALASDGEVLAEPPRQTRHQHLKRRRVVIDHK